jgi:hypothetical protein
VIDDPSEPLQRSVFTIVTGNTAVAAIIGGRLFDRVPPEPVFPYCKFGEFQLLPENGECLEGAQVFMTLHAFSRPEPKVGSTENKKLGRAIIAALDDADLTTPDVSVNSCLLESVNYITDPDGLTSHGVLVFSILTD